MSGQLLSVVIPVRNDSTRLELLLNRLATLLAEGSVELGTVEVIVVDDGSRDDTVAVARRMAAGFARFHLLELPWPCGRGVAVRGAVASALGENVVLVDVGRPVELTHLPLLVGMLSHADMVVVSGTPMGSRPGSRPSEGRLADAAHGLSRMLTASREVEIKAMRTESGKLTLALLGSPGFHYGSEAGAIASSMGLRILEMPVFWQQDSASSRHVDGGVTSVLLRARRQRRSRRTQDLPWAFEGDTLRPSSAGSASPEIPPLRLSAAPPRPDIAGPHERPKKAVG